MVVWSHQEDGGLVNSEGNAWDGNRRQEAERRTYRQIAKCCEGLCKEKTGIEFWQRGGGRNGHGGEAYVPNKPSQWLETVHHDDDNTLSTAELYPIWSYSNMLQYVLQKYFLSNSILNLRPVHSSILPLKLNLLCHFSIYWPPVLYTFFNRNMLPLTSFTNVFTPCAFTVM